MAGSAWRRAATLILSGRGPSDELALLMLRRSGKSRHLPDVEVFPGGLVEDCDFSGEWRPLLSALPLEPLLPAADRPATFLERPAAGDELPAEVGFRLAALRETFEETGVLLTRASDPPHARGALPAPLAADWRRRVHREPGALLELACQLRLLPDVWSLHEWSTWLTPVALPGHRHDAAFFVASVPERPPCSGDQTESETVEWRRPTDVLADLAAKRTTLMPPQMYELSRLQRFSSWSSLERFSRERASRGLDRIFPVIGELRDGSRVGLMQGDDLYPESPDTLGERVPLRLPLTLEQASSEVGHQHRSLVGRWVVCNIQLPHGHIAPVPYPARNEDML